MRPADRRGLFVLSTSRLLHLVVLLCFALGHAWSEVSPTTIMPTPNGNNAGANPNNACIDVDIFIEGPSELMVREPGTFTAFVDPEFQGTYTWSSDGTIEFAPAAGDCPPWSDTLTSDECVFPHTVRARAENQGPWKIFVTWTACASSNICGRSTWKDGIANDRLKPPPKVAVGAKFVRVDAHGVPMPDPSPTGEGEQDRLPNQAYTDMYSLSPQYNVTDVAVPMEGGELALEFRRTMSITSHNYNYDLASRSITYPTDWVLGLGWDTNIASRIIVSLDKDEAGFLRTSARVIDEVGQSLEYSSGADNQGCCPLATMLGWRMFAFTSALGHAAVRAGEATKRGLRWIHNRCPLFTVTAPVSTSVA